MAVVANLYGFARVCVVCLQCRTAYLKRGCSSAQEARRIERIAVYILSHPLFNRLTAARGTQQQSGGV